MLVSWSIVRTVRDWLEPTGFAHIVSVFGLALAIFGALLIPVDLYNVASLSDSMTGIVVDQDARQEVVEHGALIVVLYQVTAAVLSSLSSSRCSHRRESSSSSNTTPPFPRCIR